MGRRGQFGGLSEAWDVSVLGLHRMTERLDKAQQGGLRIDAIGGHEVTDAGPCVLRLEERVFHVQCRFLRQGLS
jgi:hypothetical protein